METTQNLAGGVEETILTDQSGNGGAMPSPRFLDSDWWDTDEQMHLFDPPPVTTPLFEIDPEGIEVVRVGTRRIVHLQRSMSRVVWRPAPGWRVGFEVRQGEHLIGIGYLRNPGLLLSVRDEFLCLPSDTHERVDRLNRIADLSVCVGAQPLAWHWNAGKLIAQIATTLGDWWEEESNGHQLECLTTTSVWGRGAQYNRLWKFIGYTKGFGHCHVPDHVYERVLSYMRSVGVTPYSGGRGKQTRLWNLRRFQSLVGSYTTISDHHGLPRAVYYADAVDPTERSTVIRSWFDRWGYPRYLRTRDQQPPYTTGLVERNP